MEGSPVIGITVDIEGEYLRVKHYYSEAVIRVFGIPLLIPPVGDPLSYAEKIDGLLISGGRDVDPSYYGEAMMPQVKPVPRQRSNFEIALLREIIKRHKPVLGICYGMQVINVALGGSLYQDIASQFPTEIDHAKDSHTVVIGKNRFLKEGEYRVNSTHHQAVRELGAGLVDFVFSPDKLKEAFYLEGYPFLVGVQWHPERLMNESLSSDLFHSFMSASRKKK